MNTRLLALKANTLWTEATGNKFYTVDKDDYKWLIEQAETLDKIAKRWVEIETNGTYEEASDFYTFVQETLSPKQMD